MILSQATALVTGGGVRVGRAIALGLAAEGVRVVVHYGSSEAEAHEVVERIRAGGGQAHALRADLRRRAEVERLADEARDAFGGLDVLINNASVFPAAAIGEVDEALWDETFAVNLKAPFFLIQRLAPALAAAGGAVVNMADLAGLEAWKGYAAHSLSKAALIHLTRVAARSLAPNVRVNAIAPGTVLPPEDLSDEEVRRLAERAPLRRNGSPEDVIAAVLYLLRADFVTGQVIGVDGGKLLT